MGKEKKIKNLSPTWMGIKFGLLANILINAPYFILSLFDNPHTIDNYQKFIEKIGCYFPFTAQCLNPIVVFIIWWVLVSLIFYFYISRQFSNLINQKKVIFFFQLSFLITSYPIFFIFVIITFIVDVLIYGFV